MKHSGSVPAPTGATSATCLRWRVAIPLHLLPGLVLLVFFLATAPVLQRSGLPPVWGLLVGTLVVLAPIEVGVVMHATRSVGGGLVAALSLRGPTRADRVSLLVAAAASVLLPGAVIWAEPQLRATLFGWLPTWWQTQPNLSGYSTSVQITTIVLWLISAVLVGPVVEEIYFRGWLLPRLSGSPAIAVGVHTTLFSAYHLWQPQAFLTVLAFTLPLTVLVRQRGNPVLSMIVHSGVNLVLFLVLTAGLAHR